jgi:hypothetical protein
MATCRRSYARRVVEILKVATCTAAGAANTSLQAAATSPILPLSCRRGRASAPARSEHQPVSKLDGSATSPTGRDRWRRAPSQHQHADEARRCEQDRLAPLASCYPNGRMKKMSMAAMQTSATRGEQRSISAGLAQWSVSRGPAIMQGARPSDDSHLTERSAPRSSSLALR